jgi:hypothetical protein
MFRSLFQDHLHGSSFALSTPTTLQLHVRHLSVVVCGRMPSVCVCIRCTCLCAVWSHDQTAHRQEHRIDIQIEGIRPHTNTDK